MTDTGAELLARLTREGRLDHQLALDLEAYLARPLPEEAADALDDLSLLAAEARLRDEKPVIERLRNAAALLDRFARQGAAEYERGVRAAGQAQERAEAVLTTKDVEPAMQCVEEFAARLAEIIARDYGWEGPLDVLFKKYAEGSGSGITRLERGIEAKLARVEHAGFERGVRDAAKILADHAALCSCWDGRERASIEAKRARVLALLPAPAPEMAPMKKPRCPKCGDEATYQTPDGTYWDGNAHFWRLPAAPAPETAQREDGA